MNEERCPRCKSDRVDHHCALGKIKHVCAQCGEVWTYPHGAAAASYLELPAPVDECHHCGAPSPGNVCRYCSTVHRRQRP